MEELEVLLLMLLMLLVLLVLLMLLMVLMVEVVGAQVVEGQVILLPLPWDWPGWTALAAQVSQANFVAEECRAETGNRAGRTWRCILQAAAQQRRRPLLKAWDTQSTAWHGQVLEAAILFGSSLLLLIHVTFCSKSRDWNVPLTKLCNVAST